MPSVWMSSDALVLLSRGLVDEHTRQLHPTMGTPVDVPEPRIVTVIFVVMAKIQLN